MLHSTLLMISFVNLSLIEVRKEKLSPSCIKNWTLLGIGFDDLLLPFHIVTRFETVFVSLAV